MWGYEWQCLCAQPNHEVIGQDLSWKSTILFLIRLDVCIENHF